MAPVRNMGQVGLQEDRPAVTQGRINQEPPANIPLEANAGHAKKQYAELGSHIMAWGLSLL